MTIHLPNLSDPKLSVWVNKEGTVLVHMVKRAGVITRLAVSTRDHPDDIWGPPTLMQPEKRS